MPHPIRLDGILAKVESTYGTDSVPVAATDGIRVSERVWSSITVDHQFPNDRTDSASGTLLPLKPGKRKGRNVRLSIAIEMTGAGSAYSSSNKPPASPLIRACGASETVDVSTPGSEFVEYKQADTAHVGATIYAYAGGKLYKIVGCRGRIRQPIRAGENGIIRFEMVGLLSADPTEVALPAITYTAQVPPPASGMTFTVGAWTPDVVEAEFDSGVEPVLLPDATAADALASAEIPSARPTLSLSAKTVALATYDPYADAQDAVERTIDWTIGDTQYNRAKLNATAYLNADGIGHVDQDGFTGWELAYQLTGWTLKFD